MRTVSLTRLMQRVFLDPMYLVGFVNLVLKIEFLSDSILWQGSSMEHANAKCQEMDVTAQQKLEELRGYSEAEFHWGIDDENERYGT